MKSAFKPQPYRLSVIAQEVEPFGSFSPYVPSLNNDGVLAFQATLTDGQTGVFKSNGPPAVPVAIATQSAPGGIYSHADINTQGQICFYAQAAGGEQGVFCIQHRQRMAIAESLGTFRAVGPLGPTINEAGVMAFRAVEKSGLCGIYCGSQRSPIRTVANCASSFCRFHGLPVINSSGTVVFRADLREGGQAILTDSGGALTSVVDTAGDFAELGSFPTINNEGSIAFVARLKTGTGGVFVVEDGRIRTLVDSSEGFQGFRGALLDEQGALVFYATPTGGELGIYSGPDPVNDKVLGVGDEFSGSSVVEFALNPVSVNAVGQLALRLRLKDGRQLICRAERT